MVDTITLGITQRAWDRDTHLWSREDFKRRRSGCHNAAGCLVRWHRLKGAVRYSISGSVGTAVNGHNRDDLTYSEVERGLYLLLSKFNQSFEMNIGLEGLELTRIDFFAQVNISKPEFTLRSLRQGLHATERDWVTTISSGSETVLRKCGARVECYYTKYDPNIEGHIPPSLRRQGEEIELPSGVVRVEVRLKRRAFRANNLNQLDRGIDVLQFLDRGYTDLILPPTELVQAYARPINNIELLERLQELYGSKSGCQLWRVARDVEEYGVDGYREICGATQRTISGWQKKIVHAKWTLSGQSE